MELGLPLEGTLQCRFGQRMHRVEACMQIGSWHCFEGERLGAFATNFRQLTRSAYKNFSAITKDKLVLHVFLQRLQPE